MRHWALRRSPRFGFEVVVLGALVLVAAAPADAIVGGVPGPPGRWPWMVALLDASTRDAGQAQFCGGVVIAPRRVLTAGHCVIGERTRDIEVLVGRTRLTTHRGRRLPVRAISIFPRFVSGRTPSLDAAVLTLGARVGIAPLALARPGQRPAWAPGTPAWTIGWGQLNARRSPGGELYFADRLRELQEPVQGDDACEGVFGLGFDGTPYRPAWLLCAGTAAGDAGICFGDSGGPLVVDGGGSWLDVGIVNASDACAARGYFVLYTRVDRISGFALRRAPTAQPDPITRPRVAGRLAAGARVRCKFGRWRGSPARFSVRWRRLGTGSQPVRGRHAGYRLTRRDARRGVTCSVTAANRGGRVTVAARPLRPRAE
jgi:Trypsin